MIRRLLVVLLLAVPGASLGQNAAQAPRGLAFDATLESIRITGRPDEVVTRQFRLTLAEKQPRVRFRARVEDWWRSPDGRESFYAEPGTLKRSCGKWVSLNPVDAVVGERETLVVRVTVAIPHEPAGGGYWCVLTVDEVPDPATASSGVDVRFLASVSTGIFVNVGDVRRAATILDLQVTPDEALVKVRNDGNAPLGIEGRLEFYSGSARAPVAGIDLPRATLLTEPFVEGFLTAKLPPASALPPGRYRVRVVLDFGGDHNLGAEREVDIVGPSSPRGSNR